MAKEILQEIYLKNLKKIMRKLIGRRNELNRIGSYFTTRGHYPVFFI